MCILCEMAEFPYAIGDIFEGVQYPIMTLIALVFSIIISIGSLAWGYAEAGVGSISGWIILFGLLWLFSLWRGRRWFSSLGLFLCILASMVGLWFDFNFGWMFSGSIFALFAWDMTEFRQKLHFMTSRDDLKGMERRHIVRVLLLALGGLFFASILMFLRQ
ncbi:MAG: hypothetical protein C4586_03540 [Anaerolineaceae bacterium]|nr:MAG: hypothetical protein C4586_03540 [Anaerolineaceae bacterium]